MNYYQYYYLLLWEQGKSESPCWITMRDEEEKCKKNIYWLVMGVLSIYINWISIFFLKDTQKKAELNDDNRVNRRMTIFFILYVCMFLWLNKAWKKTKEEKKTTELYVNVDP